MKAIITGYGKGDERAGEPAVLVIQVFYYGGPGQPFWTTAQTTVLDADTAAQIRTKVINAVVADATARGFAGFVAASVLLPTYAVGS